MFSQACVILFIGGGVFHMGTVYDALQGVCIPGMGPVLLLARGGGVCIPSEIQSTGGRYASHYNAYLLMLFTVFIESVGQCDS